MRIGDAAVTTDLTKKAIKHYEAEGLVTPRTDPQSGYREYDDEAILRLELIHTLRLLVAVHSCSTHELPGPGTYRLSIACRSGVRRSDTA